MNTEQHKAHEASDKVRSEEEHDINEASDESRSEEREYLLTAYSEERKYLLNAYSEQSISFDKTLTTLATAMFAFSVGYVQFLKPDPINATCLLVISWVLLGVSLFAVLSSFVASQRACLRQIEIVEMTLLNPAKDGSGKLPVNAWGILTGVLNWISYSSFAAALCVFGVFVYMNLLV